MKIRIYPLLTLSTILLASCGGGGNGGGSNILPAIYTVGISVEGMTGTSMVIQNNAGDDITVTGNGSYSFSTQLATGDSYTVSVSLSPERQKCTVSNGKGIISDSSVSNVLISCYQVTASEQILSVRANLDGGPDLNLRVDDALVTYIKPSIGTESAGFFLQADATGPAIYLAIDPASLTPIPKVGDKVSVIISSLASEKFMRHITALSSYTLSSEGNPVAGLVQDITQSSDLITGISNYESELVSLVSGKVSGPVTYAGNGYIATQVDTSAIAANSLLVLRIPESMNAILGLEQGCQFNLPGTPLWRFIDRAQLSAWTLSDISVSGCPPARVLDITSTSTTSIDVVFNRAIDAKSIISPSTQFISKGLSIISATVNNNIVTLTTASQVTDQGYNLTVDNSVKDILGNGIDILANSYVFTGYNPQPDYRLIINELDYDNIGTDNNEYVEIYNAGNTIVDLSGIKLSLVNGATNATYSEVDLAPVGVLMPGQYMVVCSATVAPLLPDATPAIIFPLASNNIQNGAPDGIAIVDTMRNTVLDALSYEGEITSAVLNGSNASTFTANLVEGGSATIAKDSDNVNGSVSRCPNGSDSNFASADWQFSMVLTPGSANACP